MSAAKANKTKEWFSTMDLVTYSGLPTKHMVAYLCRTGILEPSLTVNRKRGIARRFSYRDLLLARCVSTLLKSGVSVEKLKDVLRTLRENLGKNPTRALSKQYVVILGNRVYLNDTPGVLIELTAAGQLAFQFVLDVSEPGSKQSRAVKRKKQKTK